MQIKTSMLVFLLMLVTPSLCVAVNTTNVTFDGRALVINGQRRVLVSGSIHYARSTQDMWPDLIDFAKKGGLDIIDTYVFWNLHEKERTYYKFSERANLPKFISLVGKAGLYVHLRIGPYISAEWNNGGLPRWLRPRPEMKFRTDNVPFKIESERYVTKIVETLKGQNLFAYQGGPIILAQIENEYGNVEKDYGADAKPYIDWITKMALTMDVKVPWVMSQQNDAPDHVINTCNGFYCDKFTPNSDKKPKFFTELRTGGFSSWGDPVPHRPIEDIAFSAARFFQLNGTLVNYYMYHGGTNFGRTAGGPFVTTSYDYDAPIDEYGLLRFRKYGHLQDLHKSIKLSEKAMVATFGKTTFLGRNLEATVYETGTGLCSAFLANLNRKSEATLNFRGNSYDLPAWSVSILPDCKNVVYNTAKVNSMTTTTTFVPFPSVNGTTSTFSNWSWYNEHIGAKRYISTNQGLMDPNYDTSDYLWNSHSVYLEPNDVLLKPGSQVKLHIESRGHALYAFFNGKLVGSGKGNFMCNNFTTEVPVTFQPGNNSIDILSLTVGQKSHGAFLEKVEVGLSGVFLKNLANGSTIDLGRFDDHWDTQIGIRGYGDDVYVPNDNIPFVQKPALSNNTVLTWYKANFDIVPGNPTAIDFTGMGKGEAWVNGNSIGRYWISNVVDINASCAATCDYRGKYTHNKCLANCGKPSQTYYHVPIDWIYKTNNELLVFEEKGGDPLKMSVGYIKVDRHCSMVSETHPPLLTPRKSKPTLSLECYWLKEVIKEVHFADFGTPLGTCGSFTRGQCTSKTAMAIVQKACLGKANCTIEVSESTLGNPCANVTKSLAVDVTCG